MVIRYQQILARFPKKQLLVLGDIMVDEYIWGSVSRLSPEAPVPVVEVKAESFRLGGAGNVAANIRSLGGRVILVGVVGNDLPGERLIHQIEAAGIKSDGVVVDRARPTTIKTRVVAGSQQIVRFDRESMSDLSKEAADQVLELATKRLADADAVLISDYAKGVISRRIARQILSLARRSQKIIVVDPKVHHFPLYKGATVITPNHHEALAFARLPAWGQQDLLAVAGRELLRKLEVKAILVTRGEEGMSLFEDGRVTHIPAVAKEVYDVTGAGDTVLAALALAMASGASLREAAVIANHAAGAVVGRAGTATISREELLDALKDRG
ncbi:D-glycero-beta-D-manno-heptose-7-phosphate kinase [Candidatus Methylomirabilis sp.]|uniref:D-glycero-beta-D-manno-heptose-7-phosphate kinase n=1 Tax=Candidatus Methylomirabilis sp. TaxID=2032687 RepID=UPI00307665F9